MMRLIIHVKKNNNKKKEKRKSLSEVSVRLKFWSFYKLVEDTTPAGAIWLLSYPCYPTEIFNPSYISHGYPGTYQPEKSDLFYHCYPSLTSQK